MQAKGAGPVNRVELESQVLCAALRQSFFGRDKIGSFTSIRELSHLFPDLLPPPEEKDSGAESNKSDYYEVLLVRPQTPANGVIAAYLRRVRNFLRATKVSDNKLEYHKILNAGFILRKPRLRLSHDLVVVRRWLFESQEEARAAAEHQTMDHIPVYKEPAPEPKPVAAEPKPVAPEPRPAAPEPKPAPVEPKPAPVEPTPAPPIPTPAPVQETPTQQPVYEPTPMHTEPAIPAYQPQPQAPFVMPIPPMPAQAAAAQNFTEAVQSPPVPPVSSPVESEPAMPLQPQTATQTEEPPYAVPPVPPLPEINYESPAAGNHEPPAPTPVAPEPTPAAFEPTPAVQPSVAAQTHREPTPPIQTEPPAVKPARVPAQPSLASIADITPVAVDAPVAMQGDLPKSAAQRAAEEAFVFDESALRKQDVYKGPMPKLVQLLEAAQFIGELEVQALRAQMQLAPNIPVEKLILNAGYVTASEMNSVKLGETLLQQNKITMAQFQVAIYDERMSGLRMAESLQVRGWLNVEVRNAIDEWQKKRS